MLPKLANTILHSTGRLAAAIPSQTPTLRKVLELQSSGPSGRNDQAPGASRRNLPIPPPTRTRSSSLSNPTTGSTRSERTEKLGVLRTVQIHTRSRHVFAPTSDAADLDIVATLPIPPKASTLTPEQTPAKEQTTATKQTKVKEQIKVTDQKTKTPTPRQIIYEELRLASNKVDRNGVAAAIRRLKTQSDWVIAEYNMVLQALASVRREGEPLTAILDIYNEMLAKSIMPNVRTYLILLRIFIARDAEVQRLETVLEARLKRHEITGRLEKVDMEEEKKRMAVLKSETNFASALTLFDQLIAMGSNDKLDLLTYRALLRGCAHYGNIDSAIHVFGQIEKRERHLPDSICYMFLLRTFVNGKDLEGAEAVFTEYQKACHDGRVYVQDQEGRDHMRLWNLMVEAYLRLGAPEKAVEIIETMLAAPAKEGVLDTPNPSSSTFTSAITGFCESGDMDTAISWFDRLLEQGKVTDSPWTSLVGEPTKPDMVAWGVILDALAQRGMVDDLNRLFGRLLENQEGFKVQVRPADCVLVIAANLNNLAEVPKEEAMKRLDFVNRVWSDDLPFLFQIQAVTEVSNGYIAHGAYEQVDAPLQRLTDIVLRAQAKAPEAVLYSVVRRAQASTIQLTDALYSTVSASYALPWNVAGRLAELHALLGMAHKHRQAPELVRSYLAACEAGSATVLNGKWFVPVLDAALYMLDGTLLARVGTTINVSPEDISRLVKEMVTAGNVNLSKTMETRIVKALSTVYSTEQLQIMLEGSEGIMTGLVKAAIKAKEEATKVNLELDEARKEAEEARIKAREEKVKEGKQVRYDEAMNKTIGSLMLRADDARVRSAYAAFERGLNTRRVPSVYVISRLLMALGRMQEIEKVQKIYSIVHEHIVPTIPEDKRWDAWFTIEEAMVIALGHAGDIDSAHVHRMRILEQGRAPSADAYAILIQLVKDTTDDTSNAMALYQESQAHGVVPNLFLYNNIISKLSKARKADYALELFQQMKMNNVYPSSITYGAIIGACARVGDAESAENLFAEMVNARNFKPRIPPYNTMIQLYTTTKPNRERALHYLDTLKAANVQPSAHTYKLVMDAYGTIEPIEVEKMEEVFNEMCNSGIKPQGPQFASLVNSYGCAQKNLDKAIEVFNSIPSYNVPEALDAVVFEAMFNVFVVHRRADLNQEYLEKMKQAGVHMTAYIANTLIKSYATVDELDKARDVFESLLDAPVGVAAPNNHAPHNPEQLQVVSPAAPVYREPSTWEAMIRAELGAGNRAEAQALLERLQERQYPEAVFNRISGILVDHTTIAP